MGKTTKDNNSGKKVAAATKKAKSSSSPSKINKGVGGPQKILDVTLFLETRSGEPNVPRKKVATMSGVKSNTFPVTISGMKKKGWITYDKDTICLTDAGRAKANPVAELDYGDNSSAQEEVKKKFKIGGKALLLFNALLDGREHDRESLIGSLGFASKNSAAVMLSNLKKNGVIQYDKKKIQMGDICFPFGRPGENNEE